MSTTSRRLTARLRTIKRRSQSRRGSDCQRTQHTTQRRTDSAHTRDRAGSTTMIVSQQSEQRIQQDRNLWLLEAHWEKSRCEACGRIVVSGRSGTVSKLSTFMTQGEACQNKSLKVNKDGCCKEFCHVPHFVVPQTAVRSSLPCCPCISATSTPRRKASPRSSSKLFVSL